MTEWATRRKTIYLIGTFFVVGLISFFVFLNFWYKKPTCFDGFQNGKETGVDCGGECSLICKAETLPPLLSWDPRLFRVSNGIWNMLVYVENQNTDATAVYAPYKITIFDSLNNILYQKNGATVLPKRKITGIFDGPIYIDQDKKPAKTLFEFGNDIVWQKTEDYSSDLIINHSPLLRIETSPRIEATIKNDSLDEIKFIELVVAVFDGNDNAIATSRTFIESIKKGEVKNLFFNWPQPFKLGERACTKKSKVVLLLDRSGSMASIGKNPPEPLTSAKNAAKSFVEKLRIGDNVGIISFANEATIHPGSGLTTDFSSAQKAIESISINKDGTQYTNIFSAISSAGIVLNAEDYSEGDSKVLVLLTDGQATYPLDPNAKNEDESIIYAENLALNQGSILKKDGVQVYTIGLGDNVNNNFLEQLASKKTNFFFAPKAVDLERIYANISSDICKEVPARIEITSKVLDV